MIYSQDGNHRRSRQNMESGWLGRRRTYTCRSCGHKFQVDTRDPLGELDKYCPFCIGMPVFTFKNSRGKTFKTRTDDLSLAQTRAWAKDKTYKLVPSC